MSLNFTAQGQASNEQKSAYDSLLPLFQLGLCLMACQLRGNNYALSKRLVLMF